MWFFAKRREGAAEAAEPERKPRGRKARAEAAAASRAPMPRPALPLTASGRLALVMGFVRRSPIALASWVAIVAFAGGLVHFVREAGYFEVVRIEIQGTSRVPEAEVDRIVREGFGETMLLTRLDPSATASELMKLPGVHFASLERTWPKRLRVTIEERVPVGLLVHTSGMFVVSDGGLVIDKANAKDLEEVPGPFLTGFDSQQPAIGVRLNPEGWQQLARWRAALGAAGESVDDWSELHWDESEGLALIRAEGTRVLVGRTSPAESGPVIEEFFRQEHPGADAVAMVDARAATHLTWTPRTTPKPSKKSRRAAAATTPRSP